MRVTGDGPSPIAALIGRGWSLKDVAFLLSDGELPRMLT